MKQKYALVRDDRDRQLVIKEFAELEKDLMSLMCEESYDFDAIGAAIANGRQALIRALRTKNLYPPSIYADKIATAVTELFADEKTEALELFFDDVELLTKERKSAEAVDDPQADSDDLDELLEDDDSLYGEKELINKRGGSIKVEDDQYGGDVEGD